MSNLIDPDRPLMAFITKMAYSAYLNILWLICCLPIVTIACVHYRPVLRHLKDGRGSGRRLDRDVFPGFPAELSASHQTLADFVGHRGVSWQ